MALDRDELKKLLKKKRVKSLDDFDVFIRDQQGGLNSFAKRPSNRGSNPHSASSLDSRLLHDLSLLTFPVQKPYT